MRKWLIGVAAVIIVLLLLPFLFGLHAQHLLKQLDEVRIPIKKGELGTVEFNITDIHRGWLSSTATINLNYTEAHAAVASQETQPGTTSENTPATQKTVPTTKTLLIAKAKIIHGPILWRPSNTDKQVFWGQALLHAPVDYVAQNLPERFLEVTGLETGAVLGYISLLGDQQVYVNTNEISFQDAAGQWNFSGFDLGLERSRSGDDLMFDLTVPHFNFLLYPTENKKDGVRWLMDGIEIDFIGHVDHPSEFLYGTWLGEIAAKLDTLQIETNGQQYAVNRLVSITVQKPGKEKNLLDGKSDLAIENVTINQQIVGPVEALVSYSNIDRPALEDMRKLYFAWASAQTDKPFMAYLTPAQQQEFLQDAFNFVNYLPSYEITNLGAVTKAGTVKGDFAIKVTAPAKTKEELQTLEFWQQNIDAKIDINASQALTEEITTWGLARFYNWMNPMFGIAPQPEVPAAPELPAPATPEATAPGATPNVPAPAPSTAVDYHGEAQSLLKQAQTFGIIKSVDKNYVLSARYEQGLLSINDKPLLDLSNKPAQGKH